MLNRIRIILGKPFRWYCKTLVSSMEWNCNQSHEPIEKRIKIHNGLNKQYKFFSSIGKKIEGYKDGKI